MDNTYEYIDDNGKKFLLDILSIFTIDGYDGKYAIASSNDYEGDEIVGYCVVENDNTINLKAISDDKIKRIIQDMVDTLLR